MWLEAYWALFAHKTFEGEGLRLLQNPNLPLLEVNAGYGTNLALLGQYSQQLERPCLLVSTLPPDAWQVQHRLHLLGWYSKNASSLCIEQVPWTRADWLAQAWCEQHKAQPWQALVGLELARIIQHTPELCAYVALESDKPVGMAIAAPQKTGATCGWWAGERQVAEALFARACTDFAEFEVAVPAQWGLGGLEVCISHASDAHIP
jgi:hypothetical protein